jgi:hypothetical protein
VPNALNSTIIKAKNAVNAAPQSKGVTTIMSAIAVKKAIILAQMIFD